MNLLPFVVVIIVILSLFSQTFFSKHKAGMQEVNAYKSYFQGMRELRNLKEKRAYKELLNPKDRESLRKEGEMVYFRELWEGAPLGRVNLSLLLTDLSSTNALYQVVLKYLENLYGPTFFKNKKDKKLLKQILDGLLNIQRKRITENQSLLGLHEIDFKDSRLKDKYFKILIRNKHL